MMTNTKSKKADYLSNEKRKKRRREGKRSDRADGKIARGERIVEDDDEYVEESAKEQTIH